MSNRREFHVGDRVRYVGYPIETIGTVKKTDSTHFYTEWDDRPGRLAAFPHNQSWATGNRPFRADQSPPGRVVHD